MPTQSSFFFLKPLRMGESKKCEREYVTLLKPHCSLYKSSYTHCTKKSLLILAGFTYSVDSSHTKKNELHFAHYRKSIPAKNKKTNALSNFIWIIFSRSIRDFFCASSLYLVLYNSFIFKPLQSQNNVKQILGSRKISSFILISIKTNSIFINESYKYRIMKKNRQVLLNSWNQVPAN